MPSARASQFRGPAGILRDVDATIVGLKFTDVNPLSGLGTPKPGKAPSTFRSLWAVLDVLVDGAEASSIQPLFVGDADNYTVLESGFGVSGAEQFSQSSGWHLFLASLNASGFDETVFPDDDPLVADYENLVGARVRLNWQVNDKATKKYGMKPGKTIDPKTGKMKEYPREDLIVTNYYGQADAPVVAVKKTNGAIAGKAGAIRSAKTKVDIPTLAADEVLSALASSAPASDGVRRMSTSKLTVKFLTQLADKPADVVKEVQGWAKVPANLLTIEGVTVSGSNVELTV